MVVALNFGHFIVEVSHFIRLQSPAVRNCSVHNLIVLHIQELLRTVGISKSVHHERVHGTGNALLLLGLFAALFLRSVGPSIHILDGDMGEMKGALAHGGIDGDTTSVAATTWGPARARLFLARGFGTSCAGSWSSALGGGRPAGRQ